MTNQEYLKVIILVLIAFLTGTTCYILYVWIDGAMENSFEAGEIQGKMDGRIEGWNSFLQDVCYDGMIVIGTNNETGQLIQKSLNEVCGG